MTKLPAFIPILDDPQFTRWDVTAIAEISDGQLKGILDSKHVVMSSGHNPGYGRRRMFTGSDILRIVVTVGLSRCGYPQEAAHVVADAVLLHACNKLAGRAHQRLLLMSFPAEGGKSWCVTPVYEDMEQPNIPPFAHAVQADAVIDSVVARLQMYVDEAPGPTGPLRLMPGWTTEFTLVGLDKAETAEMSELASQANSAGRNPHKHPRYRELWQRYDEAFRQMLADDMKEKKP